MIFAMLISLWTTRVREMGTLLSGRRVKGGHSGKLGKTPERRGELASIVPRLDMHLGAWSS